MFTINKMFFIFQKFSWNQLKSVETVFKQLHGCKRCSPTVLGHVADRTLQQQNDVLTKIK